MRTAILRIAQNQLQDFIAVAGIEMQGKLTNTFNSFFHYNSLYIVNIFVYRITGSKSIDTWRFKTFEFMDRNAQR